MVVIFEFDEIRIPTLHIGEGVWTPQAKYRRTNDDARKHTPTLLTTGHSTYEMEWLRRLPSVTHQPPSDTPTANGYRPTGHHPESLSQGGGDLDPHGRPWAVASMSWKRFWVTKHVVMAHCPHTRLTPEPWGSNGHHATRAPCQLASCRFTGTNSSQQRLQFLILAAPY